MGIDFSDLFEKKEIELSSLKRKIIAIDSYNTIYQFLSVIRQRDGSLLVDSKGEVTSHLSGFLYRTTGLIETGIKPVFVFDGKPPDFKDETIKKRKKIRTKAMELWKAAKSSGDENAFKYAQASSHITEKIVEDSKKLLELMGLPIVQAPSEGEAQAAFMVKNKDAYAVASQDYDALLFGASFTLRNLTSTEKRKYELIELEPNLKRLEISQEQLVDIALIVGTDYNDGIKRVGPKTALKLIKKHGNIKSSLSELKAEIENLEEIKELFLNPDVTQNYKLKWKLPDRDAIMDFLCNEHDFLESRVEKVIDRLFETSDKGQHTLDNWF